MKLCWEKCAPPLASCDVHGNASGSALKALAVKGPLLPILLSAVALPALAQGAIGVIPRGVYNCELPGDAATGAGIPQPERRLTIKSASRYTSSQGSGTYLRRGDTVTLTSGPRQGERYMVESDNFLRLIEGEEPGRLRCVRTGH